MFFGAISRAGPILFSLLLALACFATSLVSTACASEVAVSAQDEVGTTLNGQFGQSVLDAQIDLSFAAEADQEGAFAQYGAFTNRNVIDQDQSYQLDAPDEVARVEERTLFVKNQIPEVSRGRCKMYVQGSDCLMGYCDSRPSPRATDKSGRFSGAIEV